MCEVIIPWRDGCPHRERALEWVLAQYYERTPWEVTLAIHAEGPWRKAAAVAGALERSVAEVVVVADADVWTEGVFSAVRAVTCGVAAWAVPHFNVRRLDEECSEAHMEGRPYEFKGRVYRGMVGGGVVVTLREAAVEAPLDPRFEGWGQEDES